MFLTKQFYPKRTNEEINDLLATYHNVKIKLVRGAYIIEDRKHVFDHKAETDYAYDQGLETLAYSDRVAQIVAATHNIISYRKALELGLQTAGLIDMSNILQPEDGAPRPPMLNYIPFFKEMGISGFLGDLLPYAERRADELATEDRKALSSPHFRHVITELHEVSQKPMFLRN